MAEKEYRSFEGKLKNLQKKNPFLYDVDIYLLNDKVNRNNWQYTDMEGNKNQFCGTPILIAYVDGGKTIGAGHEMRLYTDPKTGEEVASFTGPNDERIVGAMSEDENDIRVVVEDGVPWIVGKGSLWKWYARELVEKIEKDAEAGHDMSISIETLVTKSHMDGDVEVEDEYTVLGTTILGDKVMPAVADARVIALNELTNGFNELKLRAASYINSSEEGEEDEEEKEPDEEPENDKPQKHDNNDEGDSEVMKTLSKKQLAELSSKFEGYTVLSAGQDDNGVHVCLMSDNGDTFGYTIANNEEYITPDKFVKMNTQARFEFGEDCVVAVDSCELTDKLSACVIKANAENERLTSELSAANETIKNMTAAELARRVKAGKAKAKDTLDRFNANREEKISDDILVKVNECIDNGDYSECVDANGCWNGEENIENAVLAKCAAKVMELDKANAARNNSHYIWEGMNKGQQKSEGVESILSHFGIE